MLGRKARKIMPTKIQFVGMEGGAFVSVYPKSIAEYRMADIRVTGFLFKGYWEVKKI